MPEGANNQDLLHALEELPLQTITAPLTAEEFDRVLARALDAVPCPSTKGGSSMKKRSFVTLLIAAAICLFAIGAAATGYLMSPREIANRIKDQSLLQTFEGLDAIFINETQTDAGYNVTLMGLANGESLKQVWDDKWGQYRTEATCAVFAITNADGSPMPPLEEYDPFGVTATGLLVGPLIGGYDPVYCNPFKMGLIRDDFVEDGVRYIVMFCDNIYPFADHPLYVAVQGETFYNTEAYTYDEVTGTITANPNYEGLNLLFSLPIDPAYADPVRAARQLKAWNALPPN